jgi:hypothetical protein
MGGTKFSGKPGTLRIGRPAVVEGVEAPLASGGEVDRREEKKREGGRPPPDAAASDDVDDDGPSSVSIPSESVSSTWPICGLAQTLLLRELDADADDRAAFVAAAKLRLSKVPRR